MDENFLDKFDDIKVDSENLYREENYTDLKVATIRCLIPIKPDGTDDESRKRIYTGQTQVFTGQGMLPIEGEIEAESLTEAVEKFPEATKAALEKMIQRAQDMQREEANRIVIPGQAGAGGPGPDLSLR